MKHSITQGLGYFTPEVWSDIREKVEESEPQPTSRNGRRSLVLYAKLGDATQVANRARWKYGWEQVVRSANTSAFGDSMFLTLVGGRNSNDPMGGTAKRYGLNLCEVANTATIAFGFGVTNGITLTSVVGFEVKRIPQDTIVEMRLSRDRGGAISPTFSMVNPIDGQCVP